MHTAPTTRGRRVGGVLLEVLLSIALFVGAAAFTLGTTRSVLVALDRAGREAMALDLARARMSELEAHLVTLSELREDARGIFRVGSVELLDPTSADPGMSWELTLRTERSAYTGLTLVEITVEEAGADVDEDSPQRARATLRQLVALREEDAGEYEEDDLLRGLPVDEAEAPR